MAKIAVLVSEEIEIYFKTYLYLRRLDKRNFSRSSAVRSLIEFGFSVYEDTTKGRHDFSRIFNISRDELVRIINQSFEDSGKRKKKPYIRLYVTSIPKELDKNIRELANELAIFYPPEFFEIDPTFFFNLGVEIFNHFKIDPNTPWPNKIIKK